MTEQGRSQTSLESGVRLVAMLGVQLLSRVEPEEEVNSERHDISRHHMD